MVLEITQPKNSFLQLLHQIYSKVCRSTSFKEEEEDKISRSGMNLTYSSVFLCCSVNLFCLLSLPKKCYYFWIWMYQFSGFVEDFFWTLKPDKNHSSNRQIRQTESAITETSKRTEMDCETPTGGWFGFGFWARIPTETDRCPPLLNITATVNG
jgi:hypothetical protein